VRALNLFGLFSTRALIVDLYPKNSTMALTT